MGRLRVSARTRLALAVTLAAANACGSRTTFDVEEGPPPPPECTKNQDCDGYGDLCSPVGCIAGKCQDLTPVNCDDQDPCTLDRCDADTGQCSWEAATLDLDGDGHSAPLPGKKPGDLNACGDDCDDTNPAAHPGGSEVCDGVDNDCDGIVDNGAALISAGAAVPISDGATRAYPASIAYGGGDGYLAAYSGEVGSNAAVFLSKLSRTGTHPAPGKFTAGPADAYGGPLAWTGDRFGLAWSDRREARSDVINYEVYFNIVNPDGTKRNPDTRVTFTDGFSINPTLAWTGNEFVVLWQDDGMGSRGLNEAYGQRIDVNGALLGGNTKLVSDFGPGQTAPAIAAGQRTLGVVWMRGDATTHELWFAAFDHQLELIGSPARISGNMSEGVYPVIVYNKTQYIIAWFDPYSALKTVYAAVQDELGGELVAAQPMVKTSGHARYPALLPYGDRSLFVWSDDRDQNLGYELYAKTIDDRLQDLTPETRLTNAVGQSTDAVVSFGPAGGVGVLFGDDRSGAAEVYFTHLECVAGGAQMTQAQRRQSLAAADQRRNAAPAWCNLPGSLRPMMCSASLPASMSFSMSSPVSTPIP